MVIDINEANIHEHGAKQTRMISDNRRKFRKVVNCAIIAVVAAAVITHYTQDNNVEED